jgi:Cu/Ag efflux pump CusA
MAIVVIGGVFFSTVFTLFVVPCAYSLLTVFERNKRLVSGHAKNILKGENEK